MDSRKETAVVLSVERASMHDGPGVRTTVFLKGCPLRCLWCHNPESQDFGPVLAFHQEKCILCGACAEACAAGVHVFSGLGDNRGKPFHAIERTSCSLCGDCAASCPAGALEVKGREMTVKEIMGIVLLDRPFYDASRGGLTISGGEPMARFPFTMALLKAAGDQGIHRCVETCGHASHSRYRELAGQTDLFLIDWKESDPERHRKYTGVDNVLIESNIRLLNSLGSKIILRCPVIPTLNDRADHFKKIASLAEELDGITAVEVMAYHPLGASKSRQIGLEYPLEDLGFVNKEQADQWRKEIARATDKVMFD